MQGRYCYSPVTDEEPEAQRGSVLCLHYPTRRRLSLQSTLVSRIAVEINNPHLTWLLFFLTQQLPQSIGELRLRWACRILPSTSVASPHSVHNHVRVEMTRSEHLELPFFLLNHKGALKKPLKRICGFIKPSTF